MSYNYEKEKSRIINENGFVDMLKLYKRIEYLCSVSGCVSIGKAISELSGDSWVALAYLDFLKEKRFIKIIETEDVYQNAVIRIIK